MLKIVIPGPLSLEMIYIVFVAAMLLLRTYFDIWMIRNTTAIERWDKRITTEIPL